MQSIVELLIHAPHAAVAEALGDPRNNPEWMHDIAQVEPVHGRLGESGSRYRLVPKNERQDAFVATVLERRLPDRLELVLDRSDVTVTVTIKLVGLDESETQLISQELFTFHGLRGHVLGLLAMPAIKRAHRKHMAAFKRFAERSAGAHAVPVVPSTP